MKAPHLLLAIWMGLASSTGAQGSSTAGRPTLGPTFRAPTPRTAQRPELFDPLGTLAVPALPVEDLVREDEVRAPGEPLRVGVVQEVAPREGLWTTMDDGSFLWTLEVEAPGARGVRLLVAPWHPSPGAELVVYSADDPGQARGPLRAVDQRAKGEIWTPTIYAERVRLEYFVPAGNGPNDAEARMTVVSVANQYRGLDKDSTDTGALSCNLDVSCYPSWANQARSVGRMTVIVGSVVNICSGALLDREPSDGSPIFMTAEHCAVSDGNADTVEVTWLYQSTTCNGVVPSLGSLATSNGSTALVSDWTSDWSLVGLDGPPPAGLWFSGWDSSAVVYGSSVTGIHHPGGTKKRISFGSKTGFDDECGSGSTNWHVIEWPEGSGVTEGGSSGSPLFDTSGRVRGTLSCGPNPNCNSSNEDHYGQLSAAFPNVSPFLEPADPLYVDGAFGGVEQGTSQSPFATILEASFAVVGGSDMYIEAGTYAEPIEISRAMTLHATGGDVILR